MDRYRILGHTADTAIETEAMTLSGLIENLAFGMFDLMFDLGAVPSLGMTKVEVSAETVEELVVDLLSELLFEAETRDLVFSAFSVKADESAGEATVIASGSTARGAELRGPPIKAVTYHDLAVVRTDTGWYGRVVFDV